ncbi:hypothetical protein A2442_01395 [Candidatus Campbellbacteria bacterium RIFOXYC2_FULL_35_25]|uniref:Nucleotide-diphospho-sugar transferase domain-containing protein n=1 Tax=Candidatus Campbellbacteria bacterium RIFOXYC2_FULL_35_25 TaxID=1797582 RepID=A0A1F5EHI4_9BACT|nr:MAG: hypothetical protein A2442_01395 [Candidatus Campbellbacteria bacterium RIFOXYC2_FULL_35_25]
MIFRWTIWGEYKLKNIELLKYSILSFKKQFGESHNYVVYTDDEKTLKENLRGIAEIFNINSCVENKYNIKSKATWMKWCPLVKLDIDKTEIYVDSDVFLLKYPIEIENFITNPKLKFAIMDEFYGQPWQHGAMQKRATKVTPFVNAGLFIQKAGYSISGELSEEFDWWVQNISKDEQTHHDEQGALAVALTNYLEKQELYILPKDKYMLIGPNENKGIKDLEQVILFHAVYPDHPAFYKFKDYLDKILNL